MSNSGKFVFPRLWNKSTRWLWALLLLALPFTSFPLVTRITGGQMVAVPSGLIALALLTIWLLPKILGGMAIPKHTLPLFLFVSIAIVSTILGYFSPIPAFKGHTLFKENLESIITLALGVSFYLITLLWLRDKNTKAEFDRTLRLITWGGMLIIAKALFEVLLWKTYGRYPDWFRAIHALFSTGPLFRARVAAFAYEPSWLADQLNLLYIPYWFAAALTRRSAFKRRLWVFQVEDICLTLGAVTLVFTLSRLGYLSLLLMIGVLFLRGTSMAAGWIQRKMTIRSPRFAEKRPRALLRLSVYLFIALIYLGLLLAAVYALSRLDYRNEEIFDVDLSKFNLLKYAEDLSFGARVSYWITGWNIFSHSPILGVGLGNAGFYFPENLPPYAWRLTEVWELLFHTDNLLNIKSLWFRILAETGILGFSAFVAFLAVILAIIALLRHREDRLAKTLHWMGLFAFVAFLIEQLSLDSFALPYFWISFGLVAAGYEYFNQSEG